MRGFFVFDKLHILSVGEKTVVTIYVIRGQLYCIYGNTLW